MKIHLFERWRTDVINLTALTCLQGSNAVIPLLIVPFAIARLGATAYADVAIAEAISMIAVAAVLYSFEVDGVSRIIGFRLDDHRSQLSTVLSTVLFARLLIFIGVSAILLTIATVFTSVEPVLLAGWLLVPLGQVFHSYWFYQGVESNVPPALLTLTARLSSLTIVVLCVHSSADRVIVPLAVGVPFALAGFGSLLYMIRAFRLQIHWTGRDRILDYLASGRRIFTGTAAVMLYREVNVILISLAGVPATAISSYSLAEKSIKMVQAVTRPLTQITFPKVLRALHGHARPDPKTARIIGRYTVPQIALVAATISVLWLGFDHLADIFPSLARFKELPQIGLLLAIVVPAPLFGIANFMLGSAGLNFLNAQQYYLRAILVTGLVSLTACLVLSSFLGAVGAAICFVGAELTLFLMVVNRYRMGRRALSGSLSRG